MPTPLRYEEQTNFEPPTPRQRNHQNEDHEWHEYEIRFTDVRHEYNSGIITARSLQDAWNAYYNGEYEVDCDDSEVMDTIDIEIEEI